MRDAANDVAQTVQASYHAGNRDQNDACRAMVADLVSLVDHVQKCLRLIEQTIAGETAHGGPESSTDVIVLDDVSPRYVRAAAAMQACDVNLGIALRSLPDDIIARLDLKPHPEGGHYRETFRDARVDADGRSRSTAIYFLLARGERSHWHRIDAAEAWHYYAGASLTLRIADESGERSVRLGSDLAGGEVPQAVVPPQAWQSAESTGEWTLVGCTVAPGFEFATFELAEPDWFPAR